jgi:hypothetical protein
VVVTARRKSAPHDRWLPWYAILSKSAGDVLVRQRVQQKVVALALLGVMVPVGAPPVGAHVPGSTTEGGVGSGIPNLSDRTVGMPGQVSGTLKPPVGVRHSKSRNAGPEAMKAVQEPPDGAAQEQAEHPRVSLTSP